jgi:hypothetical protein
MIDTTGQTRWSLPRGRYVVRDGGWYIIYDSPGFTLDIAQEDDVEGLRRLMAKVTKLQEGS